MDPYAGSGDAQLAPMELAGVAQVLSPSWLYPYVEVAPDSYTGVLESPQAAAVDAVGVSVEEEQSSPAAS